MEKEALERIGMAENTTGVSGLGLWFGGYKLFTHHGEDHKGIYSPADFQGLQIAVPDNALLEAQYRHWGAKTIAILQHYIVLWHNVLRMGAKLLHHRLQAIIYMRYNIILYKHTTARRCM